MSRPVCIHCGKFYGKRTTRSETVKWNDGEPKPEYRGNGIVVRERTWQTGGFTGNWHGTEFGPHQTIAFREIWDGESWRGSSADPFCTLRCALDYARETYHGRQTRRNVR